jgi:hypothetical protein
MANRKTTPSADPDAQKREICIHYDLSQINLGEDCTDAVDGWLDNLAALIASEFNADVRLCTGYTAGRGDWCADDDVNDRLREISTGDEWIDLIPAAAEETTS